MPDQPTVSVLIATYNDASFLRDCVDSALAQQFDGTLEVVIVDDGSDTPASEVYHPADPRVKERACLTFD